MILPYTHEDLRARRWPVVTIALVVVNVLAFGWTWFEQRRVEPAIVESFDRAVATWRAHPELELPASIEALLRASGEPVEAPEPPLGALEPPSVPPARDVAELQRELDDEGARFDALVERLPAHRFGYVPSQGRVLTLVTSMFMHGGLLHLLGNLWFLWLASVSLEDRWGRPVYLLFYLAAGALASLAHGLTTPDVDVPLVGASGAVAGAMGAFLVLFAKTRIKFVYMITVRVGRFAAPAYVMLPLWLLEQLGYAVLFPSGGVAYGAHVAGFVLGAGTAAALKLTKVDARLDRAVDATVTVGLDERVLRAEDASHGGRHEEARALAADVLAEAEQRGEAGRADLLAALRVLHREGGDTRTFERFVRLAATDDFTLDEAATEVAARVRTRGDAVLASFPASLRHRLADRLEQLGDADAAARVRPAPVHAS